MPENLADKDFWENDFYSAHVEIPCRPNPDFGFDRALAGALTACAPAGPGDRVIEIGCAPAKWLLFYAERFGARVSGVEYTPKGARMSAANLEAGGVDGAIHEADFFDLTPKPHELVLSFGFIEHFDDLDATFARHLEFVAPGGRLALGVPNFRAFNRMAQWLADPAFLHLHNLTPMRRRWFRDLAKRHGLILEHLGYLGGFEPALITPDPTRALPARLLAKSIITGGLAVRRVRMAERVNSPLFSSYLLGVFRRP